MKNQKLKELIDQHTTISFPQHPDSEELSQWILDLAELDAYYLGIANVYCATEEVQFPVNISRFEQLLSKLNSIHIESSGDLTIVNECYKYINSLHNIVTKLIELQ